MCSKQTLDDDLQYNCDMKSTTHKLDITHKLGMYLKFMLCCVTQLFVHNINVK